jgi:hypothetical protein
MDIDLFKSVCDNYGVKIEKVDDGNGGIFYTDENGNQVKINIEDIFPELKE